MWHLEIMLLSYKQYEMINPDLRQVYFLKKSVAYSSQKNHTNQQDFFN